MAQVLPQDYELVDVAKLTTHPENPRSGDVELIASSIGTHGFYGSVVAQRSTGRVLVGNHRLMAAQQQGLDELPVIWVDVDDHQARRIMLVDNRMGERATWDFERLAEVLAEVAEVSEDDLEALGWEPHELEALLGAEWTPDSDPDDLAGFSNSAGSSHLVKLSLESWAVVDEALRKVRAEVGDDDLDDEAALVQLARLYLDQ